jgi:transmembrane sensor
VDARTRAVQLDVDVDSALRAVHARMDPQVSGAIGRGVASRPRVASPSVAAPRFRFSAWKVAAAAALIAGSGLVTWRLTDRPSQEATEFVAETGGGRETVRLADGSAVVLAPGSRLAIHEGFGRGDRVVALTGEAYFDIVHDEARPFTVMAGSAIIRDVGTAFSVRARSDSAVRVAVSSGVVHLRAVNPGDTGVMLHPGDAGTVSGPGDAHAEPGGATERDVAWRDGRLIFRDSPMSVVQEELSAWFGVRLVVTDSTLARRHLNATLPAASRDAVLAIIAQSLGATLEMKGDTALLRRER